MRPKPPSWVVPCSLCPLPQFPGLAAFHCCPKRGCDLTEFDDVRALSVVSSRQHRDVLTALPAEPNARAAEPNGKTLFQAAPGLYGDNPCPKSNTGSNL
jgi:hypothetical protein